DRVEGAVVITEPEVRGGRGHRPGDDETVLIRIRQRPQQHAVDDAEHRRRRTDAQAKRDDGDGDETRFATESARTEAQVAREVLERQRAELVARPLARLLDATKADESLPSRVVRRHAAAQVLLDLLLEMEPHL